MNKTDLAYFAGIFDGEGCLVLHTRTYRKKDGDLSGPSYLEVSICNNNEWLIQQVKFAFGGNVYHRADKIWVWQARSKIALEFIQAIRPYARLKRPQIEIGIVFQQRKGPRNSLSSEELSWEGTQKMLIRSFNQSNSQTKNRHKEPAK